MAEPHFTSITSQPGIEDEAEEQCEDLTNCHTLDQTIQGQEQLKTASKYLLTLNEADLLTLGMILGLKLTTIRGYGKLPLAEFCHLLLADWINMKDDVKEHGGATWNSLINAMRRKEVSRTAIADKITSEQMEGGQEYRAGRTHFLTAVSEYLLTLSEADLLTLGMALGLNLTTIRGYGKLSVSEYRHSILGDWINEKDNVKEYGCATWSSLISALRSKEVNRTGIADKIEAEQMEDCQEDQAWQKYLISKASEYLSTLNEVDLLTLGMALGLNLTTIRGYGKVSVSEYRYSLLGDWVDEKDNVRDHGGATWRSLISALRSKEVNRIGIADKIEAEQMEGGQEDQAGLLTTASEYLSTLTEVDLLALGMALGLSLTTLRGYGKVSIPEYRYSLLRDWMDEKDNVKNCGGASWSSLINALRSKKVRHTGIANKIEVEQINGGGRYERDPTRTKCEDAAIYIQEGKDKDRFINHPRGRWSRKAYVILHLPVLNRIHCIFSIALMLLAVIEEPSVISLENHRSLITVHTSLEILFLTFFFIHIILRVIWLGPKHVIKHKRTVLIIIVLFIVISEAISLLIWQKNHTRILRFFRPLFFIDSNPARGVRRVLRQIFCSLKSIINVLLLLLLTVAFFALIGYFLFATISFNYFSSFAHSFVSLFITLTTANNPDVMLETYMQYSISPLFFVTYLIITVYFISNILLAVVYSEFSNVNMTKFKSLFLHRREALQHAYSVLAGPSGVSFEDFIKLMQIYKPQTPEWKVMCMFKAMQRNRDERNWYLTEEEFYDFYEFGHYKWTKKNNNPWWKELHPNELQIPFEYIEKLVTHNWFNIVIAAVIVLYNLFLAIYTLTIPPSEAHTRYDRLQQIIPKVVSFIVVILYCVEINFRIIGMGPLNYLSNFWNMFDSGIVFGSLLFLCLETNPTYSYFLAIRPVVMVRYLIIRRQYRNILNTVVFIRSRLISVGLLVVVVFYFFAIIGMEAFGPSEDGDLILFEGCCNSSRFGVGQFYEGSTTVPIDESIATNFSNNVFLNSSYMNIGTTNVYYLNNFNNILSSYVTLFILMIVNNWYIIMEGVVSQVHWLARIYFMAFYIITLVILQVIISFIVEAFVLRIKYLDKDILCKVHKKYHQCPYTEKESHYKRLDIEISNDDASKLEDYCSCS